MCYLRASVIFVLFRFFTFFSFLFVFFCFVSFLTILFSFFCVSFFCVSFRFFSPCFLFVFFLSVSFRFFSFFSVSQFTGTLLKVQNFQQCLGTHLTSTYCYSKTTLKISARSVEKWRRYIRSSDFIGRPFRFRKVSFFLFFSTIFISDFLLYFSW